MYKLSWFDSNSQAGFVYSHRPFNQVVLQLRDGQWRYKHALDLSKDVYVFKAEYPESIASCTVTTHDDIWHVDSLLWYPSRYNDEYLFHRGTPILCTSGEHLVPHARQNMKAIVEYVLENQVQVDKLVPLEGCYFYKVSTPWLESGNKNKCIDFNEINFNLLFGLYLNRP